MTSKEQAQSNDKTGSKQKSPSPVVVDMLTQQESQPEALIQRARSDPRLLSPRDVLQLQRISGNQAVARLLSGTNPHAVIQTKLTVGAANDTYEQEADRMADQVMRSSDHDHSNSSDNFSIQREPSEEDESVQRTPLTSRVTGEQSTSGVRELQGAPEVQAEGEGSFDAGADVERGILQTRGAGAPLPAPVRVDMEKRFNADFSSVRIHSDGESAKLNKALHAQAFTHGSDIYFGASKFAPGTDQGKHLLAHELTHVVQQGKGIKRESTTDPAMDSEMTNPVSRKFDNVVQRDWASFKSGVSSKAGRAKASIVGAAGRAKTSISNAAGRAKTSISNAAGRAKASIKSGASKAGNALTGPNKTPTNKVGKVALGITEGAVNSFVGMLNPRWYRKVYDDITGIKPEQYGTGAAAVHLARLAKSSQVFQKVATVLGWAALISGIIGALGAGSGVGAAALGVSAILAFISMCLSGVVFIIQNVLFWSNVADYKNASTEQKKKMWQDLVSMLGAALGVVGGGLGANVAQMGDFSHQVGSSVMDSATQGVTSEVGKQFASAGVGQTLATTSDAASETVDVVMSPDPLAGPLIQREGEEESGGGSKVAETKAAVAEIVPLILSGAAASQSTASQDKAGLTKSLDAVSKSIGVMDTSLDKVPGTDKVKEYTKDTDTSVTQGAMNAPEKMKEAEQLVDQASKDKSKPSEVSESMEGKLDQLAPELDKAEAELGVKVTPEEKKKPSAAQEIKAWLMARLMNFKGRLARIFAKIKAKILEVSIYVLGLSEPMAEIRGDLDQKHLQTPSGILSAEGITDESTKAVEMANKLSNEAGKMK